MQHSVYGGIKQWMASETLPLSGLRSASGLLAVNTFVGLAIPFARRCGFRVVELERGYIRAQVPVRRNRNHLGTMYAGALFTLAEIPGGVLVLFDFGGRFVPILERFDITYIAAAKSDVTVECQLSPETLNSLEAQMRQSDRASFELVSTMTDSTGRRVAEGTGYYQMRYSR
ncbi:PaaI family thioesterase [Allohahella marinimesophila]